MTREELIERGKIWQVYEPICGNDFVRFEGCKTACIRWLKDNGCWRHYKRGLFRVAKLIWEEKADTEKFTLANPPAKPPPYKGEPAPVCRQKVLFTGLSLLPGQLDLFDETSLTPRG
jgi:hypothetical protein